MAEFTNRNSKYFKNFLKIQRICLLVWGHDIFGNEIQRHKIQSWIIFIIYFLEIIPAIHFIIKNMYDIQVFTDGIGPILTFFLFNLKLLILFKKKKEFYKFISTLRESWIKGLRIFYYLFK